MSRIHPNNPSVNSPSDGAVVLSEGVNCAVDYPQAPLKTIRHRSVDRSTGEIHREEWPLYAPPGHEEYIRSLPPPPSGPAWSEMRKAKAFPDLARAELRRQAARSNPPVKPFDDESFALAMEMIGGKVSRPPLPQGAPHVFEEERTAGAGPGREAASGLVKYSKSSRIGYLAVYRDITRIEYKSLPRDKGPQGRPIEKESRYAREERQGLSSEDPSYVERMTTRKVRGFSRKARKRMLESVAMARDLKEGFFCALTYSDAWVGEHVPDAGKMGRLAKKHWRAFRERLRRKFPRAWGWWRMEYQDRKSGEFVGQAVPHYHLLLFDMGVSPFDVEGVKELRQWFSRAWYEVVKTGDKKHLQAGTRVDLILDEKHAARYCAKYSAKVEIREEIEGGRRWAEIGKRSDWELRKAPYFRLSLERGEWPYLRRMVVRWMKQKGKKARVVDSIRKRRPDFSCSIFGLGMAGHDDFESVVQKMFSAAIAQLKSDEGCECTVIPLGKLPTYEGEREWICMQ